jgi:predicted transcriptional regulator
MAEEKKTITIAVESVDQMHQRLRLALRGQPERPTWSFASRELLWKTFSPRRFDMVEVMAGAGPLSIREIARRMSRDVKAVHSDVHFFLEKRILHRTADGKVEFPYDAVHVDFTITKAA